MAAQDHEQNRRAGAGESAKASAQDAALPQPGMRRRGVVEAALAGLGGLAAAKILPGLDGAAQAAPSSPGAGAPVTPNPILPRIQPSGLAVGLVDVSTPPRTSTTKPYALLNHLYHAGDGSGRLFCNDSRGKLWLINRATGAAQLFLDLQAARGSALVSSPLKGGFRSFAFHPDFARAGRPGHRKLYTISTETPGSQPAGVKLLGSPYPYTAKNHNVLAEWSVSATNPGRVDVASRREVLRIGMYKWDHNADQLLFNPRAQPGDSDYGKLYVGVGDGGNVPSHPDPYDQAQNPGKPLGKILRIDPLRQGSGAAYGVPADNPFVGRGGYLPEIWALGLRHPQNLCFDRGGTGAFLITDIGERHIEEVNLGVRGANYGWPLREGTFVTDRFDGSILFALPPDDWTYGFTYPVAQYDHDEGLVFGRLTAITGGFVYRGSAIPALVGHYVFGDICAGRVFHVPVSSFRLGSLATIKELTLQRNGRTVTLASLVQGANGRVDLRFGEDEAGELYLLTKQDGKIRRLVAPSGGGGGGARRAAAPA